MPAKTVDVRDTLTCVIFSCIVTCTELYVVICECLLVEEKKNAIYLFLFYDLPAFNIFFFFFLKCTCVHALTGGCLPSFN